jgi:hypothetical protein
MIRLEVPLLLLFMRFLCLLSADGGNIMRTTLLFLAI